MTKILCNQLNGLNELVTIYLEDGKMFQTLNATCCGEVEKKEITELPQDSFGEIAQKNLDYRVKYDSLNKIEEFIVNPKLPILKGDGRNAINNLGTSVNNASDFVGSATIFKIETGVEKLIISRLVKKAYEDDGYLQYPYITKKILNFIQGKDDIVTDPSKLELQENELQNIKDGAIDLDFVKYMSAYVGLKESTLLSMISNYQAKSNEPKKEFKAKIRKRRRR